MTKPRIPARILSPLIVALSTAFLALVMFERLADEILEGDTLRFDQVVRALVHSFASPALTAYMTALTNIGNITGVLLVTVIACAVLWLNHQRNGAVLLVVTVIGAVALMWALKILFHRQRPEPYFGIPVPSDYSFPSGHSMVSFCFYGVLAAMISTELRSRLGRVAVWVLAVSMVLGIGASRIYLGVHYPSDVLGGYLAGVVWVSGVALAYRRFRQRESGGLPK